jgi:hypothetical protein
MVTGLADYKKTSQEPRKIEKVSNGPKNENSFSFAKTLVEDHLKIKPSASALGKRREIEK